MLVQRSTLGTIILCEPWRTSISKQLLSMKVSKAMALSVYSIIMGVWDCWAIKVPKGVLVIRGGLAVSLCTVQALRDGALCDCSCSIQWFAVNFMVGQVAVFPVMVHSANEMVLPVPILYANWGGNCSDNTEEES